MPPLVIAHRGNAYEYPENTRAAFVSAMELGVEAVELDVQLTADGHVTVIHDPTLDRTTSGRGPVGAQTLAEIRTLSAGYPSRFGDRFAGERVPTLLEVLALVRDRARVLIEIKPDSVTDDAEDGVEARTLADVARAKMESEVAVISFSPVALGRCREHAPQVLRGHLFHQGGPAQVVEAARAVQAELILPEVHMLSEEMRDRARAAGLKLATWVVDDPALLPGLARFDLFGIASNRPGALIEAVRELGR